MLTFQAIGNLGADAKVIEQDGRKFVSFNVAHNDSYTDAAGQQHDSLQWVSCILNGDGGKLLPYLTKGRQVFVQGRGSTRLYSSPKLHQMMAGVNISVDRIELVGGQPEDIPSQLADSTGVLHKVYKAYYVTPEEAKHICGKGKNQAELFAKDGRNFLLSADGWVQAAPTESSQQQQSATDCDQQQS